MIANNWALSFSLAEYWIFQWFVFRINYTHGAISSNSILLNMIISFSVNEEIIPSITEIKFCTEKYQIYAHDTTFMTESKEELKNFLMKVKEESGKVVLKLNIQKMMIMVFGPITSWQMGKQRKQWQTLFSRAPKSLQMVTAAMKLKDTWLLERKGMTKVDSILKCRDIA